MNYNPFGIGGRRGSADRKRLDGRAPAKRAVPCQTHQAAPPTQPLARPAPPRATRGAMHAWRRANTGAPSRLSNHGCAAAVAARKAETAAGSNPLLEWTGCFAGLARRAASRQKLRGGVPAGELRRNQPLQRGLLHPRLPGARLPWFCRNRQRFVDEERDANQRASAGGKSGRHP